MLSIITHNCCVYNQSQLTVYRRTRFVHQRPNMRELLVDRPDKTVALIRNRQADSMASSLLSEIRKISVELSPNEDFNPDLLSKASPRFCSVTWLGQKNLECDENSAIALAKSLQSHGYNVLLHLPGRNLTFSTAKKILNDIKAAGIRGVLALQGDWLHVNEKDDAKCDFPYASDLVSFIRQQFDDYFTIGVAGYPDVHGHSLSQEEDLKYLQKKVSCGADFIITQAVFEYETLEKFAKACKDYKIDVPIIPGIFIINSYKSLMAMIKYCQINVPKNILESVEVIRELENEVQAFGIDLASRIISKILSSDLFGGVHIFSLNILENVDEVLKKLDILDGQKCNYAIGQ